ncbi:MAG: hypothetical protein E7135_08320 [Rikenellaceae bacterium]|nr:hypothetical protein [Rikenellaceae bacterium]
MRHIATIILSLIVGGTFLFSGFVKSVDPVGTSIFVEKYLATYSLEMLMPWALAIAVVLGAVELLLGLLLVAGAYRKQTALCTALFLFVFTIITLLSATVLPIGDCGCFGDAVKLTPWETFVKNLVLLPMAVVLWLLCRKQTANRYSIDVLIVAVLLSFGVNGVALRFLPLVDFLPYKEGVDLRAEVQRVRDAEDNAVRSVLCFENIATGERVEYPADATDCWTDENLEYVDAYTVHDEIDEMTFDDFRVYDADGVESTMSLLAREGSVVWLCVGDADALRGSRLRAVQDVVRNTPSAQIVVITSDDMTKVSSLLDTPCYAIDAMTLRSFMRASVGVVVITDGVIDYKRDIRDYGVF